MPNFCLVAFETRSENSPTSSQLVMWYCKKVKLQCIMLSNFFVHFCLLMRYFCNPKLSFIVFIHQGKQKYRCTLFKVYSCLLKSPGCYLQVQALSNPKLYRIIQKNLHAATIGRKP